MKKIMITGIGGEIGRNISKIISSEFPNTKIIGVDINDYFPYAHYCDEFIVGKPVTCGTYLESMRHIVNEFKPNVIIPTSEVEMRFLNEKRINVIENIPMLMASTKIMDIGFNKLLTANYLKENNFPYPITYEVSNLPSSLTYPMIAKSKDGAGSKQILKVNENNVDFIVDNYSGWIMQEYLQPDNQEYTCCVFKARSGEYKHITFKRTLVGGSTGLGEVANEPLINSLLEGFTENIDFYGSINIQLRLTKKGPIIFEINPRFSSTVLFRNLLGFKDVVWAIKDYFDVLENIDFHIEELVGKRIFKDNIAIIF